MGLNENLSIDIARRYTTHIPAKQADHGYDIIMRILRNGVDIVTPSSDTATFRAGKPDGTIYYGNATVNEDKTVSIHVDDEGQMLAVPGCVVVDVTLNDGSGAVKSTQNFVIDVQAAPGGEAIPSTSVFIELQELVDDANGKILDAEAWAVGTRNGVPVEEGDPAYDNNAKYYAEQADDDAEAAQEAASDAEGYANDAKGHADAALESANNASGYADSAQEDAENASNAAEEAEGYAESAEQSAQEAAQAAVEALWAYLPLDSASGPIANFPDGASNVPVDGLVISAEPIQDLHGYANPWPAGGGKNKFDADTVYASYKQPDGSFLMKGTQAAGIKTYIPDSLIGQSLVFSAYLAIPSGSSITNLRLRAVVGGVNSDTSYVTGNTYTRVSVVFTPTSTSDYVIITYGSSGSQNLQAKDIMLEAGSAVSDYAPYSNLCPISGRTGGSLTRTGKNVLNMTLYDGGAYNPAVGATWNLTAASDARQFVDNHDGTFSMTTTSTWDYRTLLFPVKQSGARYNVSIQCASTGTLGRSIGYLDKNFTVLSKDNTTETSWTYTASLNPSADPNRAYFYILLTNRNTASVTITVTNPSVVVDDAALPYEPYSGITIPITFPTAAGTVYGGEVDVTRGKLTVTMKGIDVASLSWTSGSFAGVTGRYAAAPSDIKPTTNADAFSGIASSYVAIRFNGISTKYGAMALRDNGYLYVYHADSPTGQLCYELATPIVYDFDPTELRTLLGTNNIWSDIGDISVQYRADVQKYIQKLVAQALNA